MDADAALRGLMTAIDERRWDDLQPLLHPDFTCRLVHTGESFGRNEWIQFNREYPGFERLTIEDLVADQTQAVSRTRVTCRNEGVAQIFECATFARLKDGVIVHLTEVWTDVEQQAPPGTRPHDDRGKADASTRSDTGD